VSLTSTVDRFFSIKKGQAPQAPAHLPACMRLHQAAFFEAGFRLSATHFSKKMPKPVPPHK
jgi:hypothetical protein